MRTMRCVSLATLIVVLSAVVTDPLLADWADTFTDDFEQAWTFQDDDANAPPDATVIVADDGRLKFFPNSAELANGNFDVFAIGYVGPDVPAGEPDPLFTDVRLRATVSPFPDMPTLGGGQALSNNDAFLAIRGNGASAYILALDQFSGGVDLLRSDNADLTEFDGGQGNVPDFDPTKSYVMEMTAVDQTITGAIFELGNNTPLVSLSITDGVYASGWSGLGAAVNDNDEIGGDGGLGRTPVAVMFDDVSSVSLPIDELLSDLTGNGFVDFEDLTVLLANWNKDVSADQGNLVEADTTVVNFDDLTVLLADWTGPGPAGAPEAALAAHGVPEPSTGLLALLGMLSLGAMRWRRK